MKTWPHKKWNPFLQLDFHTGIFLTGPIPVPGGAWHIAAGCLAYPFGGLGTNKHNGGTVFADGMEIVSRGHSPQFLIVPHWNLFPFTAGQPNVLIPLLIIGSSSKCEFAVGSVQGSDGPIAVSLFRVVGINLACGFPCSMPTCAVVNWGTVSLGFTWGDLVASVLCMAIDMLKSYLVDKLVKGLVGKLLPKGLFKSQMKSLLGKLGLPKIFRGDKGRFSSMSERLVNETVKRLLKTITGSPNPAMSKSPDSFLTSWATGKDGVANQIGAWIDGRSQSLP